jgi:hypothetical protein
LGFRLGCLGDPILVLLLKFDAQIDRKKERKKELKEKTNLKERKNLFESLMPPIRKKGKEKEYLGIINTIGPKSEYFSNQNLIIIIIKIKSKNFFNAFEGSKVYTKKQNKNKGCVSHCGLAIYIKKIVLS